MMFFLHQSSIEDSTYVYIVHYCDPNVKLVSNIDTHSVLGEKAWLSIIFLKVIKLKEHINHREFIIFISTKNSL